eukprot:5432362-Amphidinium_carterae.1
MQRLVSETNLGLISYACPAAGYVSALSWECFARHKRSPPPYDSHDRTKNTLGDMFCAPNLSATCLLLCEVWSWCQALEAWLWLLHKVVFFDAKLPAKRQRSGGRAIFTGSIKNHIIAFPIGHDHLQWPQHAEQLPPRGLYL